MSQVLCSKSGISYRVPHLLDCINLSTRETHHPIFDASYAQLLAGYDAYLDGKIPSDQAYLLYLAVFIITDRIEWRQAALRHALTDSIVAQNIAALVGVVDRIVSMENNPVKMQSVALPRYAMSFDTSKLSNTQFWIANWENCFSDYDKGYAKVSSEQRLLVRTEALDTLLRDRGGIGSKLSAASLADWASLACSFASQECIVADGNNNDCPISLTLYWKRIIKQCATKSDVYSINENDLDELLEYCDDMLAEHNSFSADTLLTVLRTAQKNKTKYTMWVILTLALLALFIRY